MRRRDFIKVIAGSVAVWPLTARAQLQKVPAIGFLGANSSSSSRQWVAAFVKRLHELGWDEGRTVAIEYRWAEGRPQRAAEIAAEFVRLKVDVILTHSTPATLAAKRATSAIPIIFATAGDPMGTGLVTSLSHPGGNVTGLSLEQVDIAGKRLELLREILPHFRTLAILANIDSPNASVEIHEVQAAARTLGIEVSTSGVRGAEDIAPSIDVLKGRADALYVCTDPLLSSRQTQINTLALGARLPTVHALREYVEAGGLMSYGPSFPVMFQRAAEYVDKILRGAKAGDIPVEQPTKFDLVINLTTAKVLGLTVPQTLLARADEVIE